MRARFRALAVAAALAAAVAAAGGARAADAPPQSVEALVAAYRAAHEAGDLGAAMNLFYWGGVDDRRRRRVLDLVERDMGRDIVRIRVVGADEAPTTFVLDGVVNRPNLPVVAHVIVEFATAGEGRSLSIHMVGAVAGNHYIALAVPAQTL